MHKLLFLLLPITAAHAQTEFQVPDITITAEPARSTQGPPGAVEFSGARLDRKKQSTIGETLGREAGVSSSYFGPNASRPIIRGLEGDRVRVLQNSTSLQDASSASQDHAVAIDPINVEKIEIVRGPGALLYGSNVVGGVVNMVTSRIPEKSPERWTGKAQTQYSSTDNGRNGALSLTAPATKKWAVHADGSFKRSDDYHVPGYARTASERQDEAAPGNEAKGRAYNSYGKTGEYAAGTSYIFDNGFIGGSFSNYESSYGTVAERFVHINMLKSRFDLAGEWRTSESLFKSIRLKNSYSHYKHDEIEEGKLGTTFKNDGNETRVEALHGSIAGYSGRIGAQLTTFDFSAEGEEAFLPSTTNRNYAFFLFEEKEEGRLKPSFSLRAENNDVSTKNEDKSFNSGSAAVGLLYQLDNPNSLALNLAYTERAPNYEELFANGAHVATHAFESGDKNLGKERSQSAELSFRNKTQSGQGSVTAFLQDYQDFIALSPTGNTDSSSNLPIYAFQNVDARLFGGEAEYRHKLPDLLPWGALEVEGKLDLVRGINRSTGDNLPRITPIRETIAVIYKAQGYQTELEVQRSERQTHTAPFETKTDAYTLVNLTLEKPMDFSWGSMTVFAKANNLFDQEARNHVSVIKDLAPLPGRSFNFGLQAAF